MYIVLQYQLTTNHLTVLLLRYVLPKGQTL